MGLRGSLYRRYQASKKTKAEESVIYKKAYEKKYKTERTSHIMATARKRAAIKAKGGGGFGGFLADIQTTAQKADYAMTGYKSPALKTLEKKRKKKVKKRKTKRKRKAGRTPRKVVYY